ncbi:S-methyl-5-thioribose-1-phosphate isomerase [Rhodoblastus acidophilus]|uniref:Methylthioribose-1-phosphate isomerase n=1 Tax=Candidatus Rhodoblastus alkanivorans TaxID=2954117 RepID=A0ABS9ZA49_9HYPH|nr:S-methyl-5-thioribose-1-phosphate isomerase [Candidatus Rhodoblastus alkanivorans]MCI4677212.1 S-methyl-5-thioribose-1-phosphate isomerase [Candidatus Rhodoblastus alkanivorans]MCI4684565.1 S-methyl-5-thioribose-1-phosphate isomerase [Candidatus Rhodoblastus alkanivorans]MDI4641886.1 S-methyl-5-thioribose-1-phosphate isomerase [Rhodoblastus acidophilus]
MLIDGARRQSIWPDPEGEGVFILDQTLLPHAVATVLLRDLADAARAIKDMQVRGAPLIGVTAAFGLALALRADSSDAGMAKAAEVLRATRPTAVNLAWALARMTEFLQQMPDELRRDAAFAFARHLAEKDIACNEAIGDHGLALIRAAAEKRNGAPVRILTHCNAGWLATVDWGTATAPIYKAQAAGVPLHVFVDETRPRNQGASLTAFELGQQRVPHTLIVDNAGGHLMQRGEIDLAIVGADRIAANGDVCNKIGTYLKALAARDCGLPFYVAAPVSTLDPALAEGGLIPIEERAQEEVTIMPGLAANGEVVAVRIAPKDTPARNPGFDVTPARLVSGIITEKGVFEASKEALAGLA